ncbi:sensor histidine kinase [Actinomadura sp. 7K507]|uniref:sensor histidine kinase n=1 Tax=Actinomadura sp. 7K507 TaxID=2530365 RepID=UPI0014051539|nr:sensor histidine kinase [Actinomadura sp. 7K507]
MTGGEGRWRRWAAEGWVCLPFLAAVLISTGSSAVHQPGSARSPDAVGYVLVTAASLALALRRRPGIALALNAAFVAAYLAAGYPFGAVMLTVPAAVFMMAGRWPLTQAALAAAADLGVLIIALYAKRVRDAAGVPAGSGYYPMSRDALVWGSILAVALAAGALLRARRQEAARVHAEQARRVASEERLRMAQDLHDSIGHGLAAIAMQAGVALHVLDRDTEEARQSMKAVRATSREALENLRAQLDGLRDMGTADRTPAPGLGDLDRLTERVQAGGVTVHTDIAPDLAGLPAAVDAAAYRILQEALTNVLRHAGAVPVRIRIRRDGDALLLDVVNTAADAPSAPPGTGLGLRGLRSQAEVLGGTLAAGPHPDGGFGVRARLPLTGGKP